MAMLYLFLLFWKLVKINPGKDFILLCLMHVVWWSLLITSVISLHQRTNSVDIEEKSVRYRKQMPFIAVTGRAGTVAEQFFINGKILWEVHSILESKSLHDAFIDLIVAYY